MFPVVLQGMYIFNTSPHIAFLFPFFFDNFSFCFQFQILIYRVTRQVDIIQADQIPTGTGQTENSHQIPGVSVTLKNLCDQATMEFVAYIHNISPLIKGSYFDCQLQGKEKLSEECVFRHEN